MALAGTPGLSALSIAVFALGIVLAMAAFGALAGGAFARFVGATPGDLRPPRVSLRDACLGSGVFAVLAGAAVLASVLEA